MFRSEQTMLEARRAQNAEASIHAKLDLSEFGSRHRSAVSFCNAHPGTIAFVLSEDGPISCILRPEADSPVIMWRPIALQRSGGSPPPRRRDMLRRAGTCQRV